MRSLTNADYVAGALAQMLERDDVTVAAPKASALSVAHIYSTICCNCDLPAHQNADDERDAVRRLNLRGWRSISTTTEHFPMLCPGCVFEMSTSSCWAP